MKSRALNILSSALIAVSAFFFATGLCLAEDTQPLTISAVSGKVEVLRKDTLVWQEAKKQDELLEGDKIKTGIDGKAELTLKDGSYIKLKEKTTLGIKTAREEISTKATQYELDFRVGEIMVELKKLKKGSSFEVETPTAVAAVRGTTFYMSTGTTVVDGEEQYFTDLFVDSDDIIDFTNTISGEGCQVCQGENSSTYGDGTTEEPEPTPASEQDAWKSGWDIQGDATSGKSDKDKGSKKGMRDVDEESDEEKGDTADGSEDVDDTAESQNEAQEDATQDQADEQDVTGLQKRDALPDADAQLREATLENLADEIFTVYLRQDIADMIDDIYARKDEAIKESIFDHQAGKVMTDHWGNRVRAESYITKPISNQVQILALNLRTAGPNAGISSLDYRVTFDRDISGANLKTLPWDDYMHNPQVGDFTWREEEAPGDSYKQLIVYERDNPESGYYNPEGAYPIPYQFSIEVKNPYNNSVKATESYSIIDSAQITDAQERYTTVWYQIENSNSISINGNLKTYKEGEADFEGYWGQGWNEPYRFTFLDYYEGGSWLMGAFYLIDDSGNFVTTGQENKDYLDDIHGIRDCINPDFNLEMVFLSSEFPGTDPNLPENIHDVPDDAYERELYNSNRTIDVISIWDITEPYTEFGDLSLK